MDAMAVTHQGECERLDRLIREVALGLIRLSSKAVTGTVECFLQRIVEEIDVDRGTLIEASESADAVQAAYGWARRPVAENDVDPDAPRLKWFLERLGVDSDPLVLDARTGDVPDGVLRAVKSAIAIPVATRGRKYTLALEAVRAPRPWPEPIIERVRFLGEMLAGAINRLQQECVLRASQVESLEGWRRRERPPQAKASLKEFDGIVGASFPLQSALARLQQVAPTDSTVLLLGETGTGKELFARALHAHSLRNRYNLVSVNCAALPPTLIESELFGHERGAFTGAVAERQGRFELAHRGTLFLDEIGDLPPEIQAKLLRVLQNREFERLGSSHTRKTDVRVIAATHRQLDAAVANGQFRADLYYRLSVFPIRLPPLRERREDIPALVWSFIRKRQHAIGRCITRVPASVMHRLQSYSWPGNIRELENVIERALIHSSGDAIELLDDFEIDTRQPYSGATTLLSVERKHIQEVLRDCDWRINGSGNAAEQLGLHPNTLRFRMKKLGIARTRPAPESSALLGSTQGAMRRH
jgi:transcriptional regulator with GAF, ATPase, and Fis domain